jgi:hypothetical protein
LIAGSSIFASVRIPKNKIANTNMPTTLEIDWIPARMNRPVSSPKPAMRDAAIGRVTSATSADTLLLRIAIKIEEIVSRPKSGSGTFKAESL